MKLRAFFSAALLASSFALSNSSAAAAAGSSGPVSGELLLNPKNAAAAAALAARGVTLPPPATSYLKSIADFEALLATAGTVTLLGGNPDTVVLQALVNAAGRRLRPAKVEVIAGAASVTQGSAYQQLTRLGVRVGTLGTGKISSAVMVIDGRYLLTGGNLNGLNSNVRLVSGAVYAAMAMRAIDLSRKQVHWLN